MKDIRFTGEPRDGEEVFKQIDLKTYTKRVFSMYGGEQRLVEIRFINPLLDAVVDRFGTKDVQYAKVDDTTSASPPRWRSATNSSVGFWALAKRRSCCTLMM